ncbi:glycosyl transferase, group 1 [Novosphingobium nitrogenifigens DSM 19370]|uniref:Glycosyl transferase, group 1 n=1 Tax=Novosphingobium nitrogenifigens DSM 19370 TaxID=983920 RepID=F1ZDU9_9SPHN|nr:glycosyltransferase [Novosphingobium nitrogenifigens]EGD57214.1 glycosyl transferase, group 1 [Novosphingobium nitrogenifigens DSM 19370]
MRILDIIASLDPAGGGPVNTARTMTRIWRDMGHQVDVLTLDSPAAPYLSPDLSPIPSGRLGDPNKGKGLSPLFDRFGYSPQTVGKIRSIAGDYDVALLHGLWNYASLATRIALTGGKLPYLVFAHGMLDPWHRSAYPMKDRIKQAIWPFAEGALLNGAKAVFFTTEAERRLAEGSYRPYRLNGEVIGYGCQGPGDDAQAEREAFFTRFPHLRDRRFLLFISRIHPKKGCDTLLKAYAATRAQLGDVDLVFAGPDQIGWQAELQALSRELEIADHVHWLGMISGPVKWGAYRAAEAFALPSHGENFGMVVAEAMACGTPVIVSDKVNLCDEILRQSCGIVVPQDLESTAGALARFAAMSQEERDAMGRAAAQCYAENYEVRAAAARILARMEHHAGIGPQ